MLIPNPTPTAQQPKVKNQPIIWKSQALDFFVDSRCNGFLFLILCESLGFGVAKTCSFS